MANQEHLAILEQGVEVWNQWRKEHPGAKLDFHRTVFHDRTGGSVSDSLIEPSWNVAFIDSLKGYGNFSAVNLSSANLDGAYFAGDFTAADFTEAKLQDATFYANLSRATFNKARLYQATIYGDLSETDFTEANLSNAYFTGDLSGTIFNRADMDETIFADADLRLSRGLESVTHHGPSIIDVRTIYRSQGDISEFFLRSAGISDSFIEYMHSLVGKPIDFYSCFISYSSKDEAFARRLYADLQNNGVRCWFAPEDMKIGDKIRYRIDESIRLYDKLLLVLSAHSVASQWVEHEVETAIGKELEGKPNVLFPIRLDQAIMESKTGWASHIRLTRHIGDFTKWKHHDDYQKGLSRLLRDLKASS